MTEIKLTDIKKGIKSLEEQVEYKVTNDLTIKYNPVFGYAKIQDILKDLSRFTVDSQKSEKKYLRNSLENDVFVNFLIIKHFTSLGKLLKAKDYDFHITFMHDLINLGWFRQIIGVFNIEEISKVLESVDDLFKIAEELDKVENKELN